MANINERVATLEANDKEKETRLAKIETRLEAWDSFIVRTLFKFTTKLCGFGAVAWIAGGNLKTIGQWIRDHVW